MESRKRDDYPNANWVNAWYAYYGNVRHSVRMCWKIMTLAITNHTNPYKIIDSHIHRRSFNKDL